PVLVGAGDVGLGRGGLAGGRGGGPGLFELLQAVVGEALPAGAGFVDALEVAGVVVAVGLVEPVVPGGGGALVGGADPAVGEPAGGLVDGGGQLDPFGAGAD